MKVKIDTSHYPLVQVTYPRDMVLDDIDTFIEELRGVYSRGRLAVIADLRNLSSNPLVSRASARHHLTEQLDLVKRAFPRRIVAEAVIANSTLLRGLYTAYGWMKKDKSYPSRAFATQMEARDWITARLRENGL